MPDYTPLGLQKLAEQAARDVTSIRCPRDGAVMRVLASRTDDVSEEREREQAVHPWRKSGPVVVEVDVECPACRRHAMGVRPKRRAGAETAGASR